MPSNTFQDFPTFHEQQAQLDRFLADLPDEVGHLAVDQFQASWDLQGWLDQSLTKWPDRKRPEPGKAILVQRGDLRRSIKYTTAGPDVTVYSDEPHAKAHNEGFSGTVEVPAHTRRKPATFKTLKSGKRAKRKTRSKDLQTVRAHRRKMNLPQRQFRGYSQPLHTAIDALVTAEFTRIFNLKP